MLYSSPRISLLVESILQVQKIISYLNAQFECREGILIVKKKLFKNPVPSVCGGGTVFFVSAKANTSTRDLFTTGYS